MKKLLVLTSIFALLLLFIKCSVTGTDDQPDSRGSNYAGSAACVSCHKDLSDNYVHNNHFKASAKAGYANLTKSLSLPRHDTINFTEDQHVVIEKQQNDLFQKSYKGDELINSEKMDIAFGSGEKAQTYGYWKVDQLFELPATYFAPAKTWTNSPGFPIDHPYYTRVIPSRCMECHTSFALANQIRDGSQLQLKEVFDKSSIIYGIDCERCHGPAAQHVKFQQEHPEIKQAKYITSIKTLTRQQQLDMCGICHAGDPVKLKSIFNFVPGDTLSNYYLYFSGASEPDVHGMQLQLLQTSRCYKETTTLTCNTCHSTHGPATQAISAQAGSTQAGSTCISCHQQAKHGPDIDLTNNTCITCHMPYRASKSLDFNDQKGTHDLQYLLRTHRIAIYPKNEWK